MLKYQNAKMITLKCLLWISQKRENWWKQMFADGHIAEKQDKFSKKKKKEKEPQTIKKNHIR